MSNDKQRQVKLFISSTFRGFYDERDILAKHVFPEIHRRCQARKVDFVEIDLRWGIPEEQTDSGEFVPVCFARIDEGRPYFLGLLGELYGTVMTSEQISKACEKYPHYAWLEKYQDRSITELEILQALFFVGQPDLSETERQATVEQALFYFREPQYAQMQAKTDDYLDSPTNTQKQNDLKQRIRTQGCRVTEYQKPDDLKEVVLEQLWALIDQAYPEGSQPTEFERENFEHDAFAQSRQRVYIHRPADFERLTAHALDESTQPLVILGESGIGKTALLANWAQDYQAKYPDDLVFWHFCGSNPASTDPIAMLRRLMQTLQQHFYTDDEIPATAEAVIEQLPHWLAKVQQRRMIVIFDGLNQLEMNPNTGRWLPAFIPANIRLFLSTIQDLSGFGNLTELRNNIFTVQDLSGFGNLTGLRNKFIEQYLARFGRQLEAHYIKRLVAASQTANPLYLQVILEELRLFGDFSKLGQRLDYYLEAETIPDLYQKVLARLEDDYQSPEYPNLVSQALSLLWATRRGLRESELLSLLKIPQAVWSPLYLALRSAIVNKGDLLNFFHDYLRQAVEQRYLTDANHKRAIHRQLADFFETLPLNTRKADELPYQLEQAGEKERLQACLTEIPMFMQLMRDDKKYELLGYWVRQGDLQSMAEVYWNKFNSLAFKYWFYRLGRFFHLVKPNPNMDLVPGSVLRLLLYFLRTARTSDKEIERIYRMQVRFQQWRRSKDVNTANSLNELASLLSDKGDYDGAESLHRRALAIYEQVLGAHHPQTTISMNNLGYLLDKKENYKGAELLFRRALDITEQVLGAQHPLTADSLNNLAYLLNKKKDYEGAEPLYRRALAIREQVLGAQHPDTAMSLSNLAGLLEDKGDYESAESLDRRALAIREQVLGAQHPDTVLSLNKLASLLQKKGDYDGAESFYHHTLAIREQMLGGEHPDTADSLHRLAHLLQDKGNYEDAEPLYRTSLEIVEKKLGAEHPITAKYYTCLANLLFEKKDYDNAESLYRHVLAIREQVLDVQHPLTVNSLNHLAVLLHKKGDYEKAEPLYRRALAIREQMLGAQHPDTATSLNNLAFLLRNKGDYDEAEPLFRRALAIHEQVLGRQHPNTAESLHQLAHLLQSKGDYDGAEPPYRTSLEIAETKLGTEHPKTAEYCNCFAHFFMAKKDYEVAEPLYRRALTICENVFGAKHPNTMAVRNNLARLLDLKNHPENSDHQKES